MSRGDFERLSKCKNTNGYRAMLFAKGEAAVRTVVVTARMNSDAGTFSTVLGIIGA